MAQASQIIRRAKKKKSSRPVWTKDQEFRYKELLLQLENRGYIVRREELKRGHCWKVLSGSCRSFSHHYVFVDSRLAPQDQISFLEATWSDVEDAAEGQGGSTAVKEQVVQAA